MIDQLPAIMVLAPMFGALMIGLFGQKDHRVCFPIVFTSLIISLGAAIGCANLVTKDGTIDYFMAGWEEPLGIGIQLRIDHLNALVIVLIGVATTLVSFFSIRRVGALDTEKTPHFYILYLLLCTGLYGITITADAFNLFVLVEITSLTSYGLIAMGSSRRGTHAAINYVLMGTIGASFYLLGVGYLYLKTGTLNMHDIQAILQANEEVRNSNAVIIAFLFILMGIWIKMAFFPLHGWLPNAYSYCPSSTACLLAPLMTKISVYVMIRVMISIFGLEWIFIHLGWSHLVVILAVIAIVAGSVLALAQREIKKMLCYLIVAEVGYMVGGAWLSDSNMWGLSGAMYHVLSDALMTLCLFFVAGIWSKCIDAKEIDDLEGVFKKMPITSACFILGALAMIGVPPTSGFFSKFYLIRGGIEGGHWEYVAALLFSSLVNAVLFFRIFEIAFFGKNPPEGHGHDEEHHDDHEDLHPVLEHEVSWRVTIPLIVTAVLIVLLGLFNGPVVEFIREAFPPTSEIVSARP
ncbi:MAG: hypothetical protein CMO55_21015 [Verrucomicrobiales bacterium]|nr:hypothetical protein [Verrucomicrobiales bacterium]